MSRKNIAKKVFVVLVNDDDPRVPHRIRDAYPEAYPYSDTVHLIKADTTATVVARRLQLDGEDEDDNPASGVILTLNQEFAGFADPALWEFLDVARRQG